LESMQKVQQRD